MLSQTHGVLMSASGTDPSVGHLPRERAGDRLADGAGARVIVIGRTGFEGVLRRDERVELVRVRTPLEAIGELGDPVAARPESRAVVLVGPDVDMGPAADGRGAANMVEAMRRAEPRVRVLSVHAKGEPAGANGVFDGHLGAAATEGELERAVFGPARPAPEPAPVDGMAALAQPACEASEPAGDAGPSVGDESLVRLVLTGKDPTEAAVELIRRRMGVGDVAFVPAPAGAAAAKDGSAASAAGAPVVWRTRTLGWLTSATLPASRLAAQASWLATWLMLRDQQDQLREAAFTDPLTGANNRRYFDYYLARAIEQARGSRGSLTVLVFDIDNFKTFNDRYGHAAGDEILRQTVVLLTSMIRPTDRVCRMGGDEFAVIFHDPSGPRDPSSRPPTDVFGIAQRFRKAICEHRFPKLGDEAPGTLTVSGGLATYPWDGQTAEELFNRADELAIRSKREGKNAITLGPGAMRECMPGGGSADPRP